MKRFFISVITLMFILSVMSNSIKPPHIEIMGQLIPDDGSFFHNSRLTGWQDVSGSMPNNELAIYGIRVDVLHPLTFVCTAQYPISWNISGHSSYNSLLKILTVQRNIRNGTFSIVMQTIALDRRSADSFTAALKITCHLISNQTVSNSVFMFAGEGFYQEAQLKSTPVQDTNLLQCVAFHPNGKMELLRRTNKGGELLDSRQYIYNPTDGFYSTNGYWNGEFTCRNKNKKYLMIIAEDRYLNPPPEPNQFLPQEDKVYAFFDSTITLMCGAYNLKGVQVRLVQSEIENREVRPNTTSLRILEYKEKQIAFVNISLESHGPYPIQVQQVKWNCIRSHTSSRSQRTVKTWIVEFVAPPIVSFDNYRRQFTCHSHVSFQIGVQSVGCVNVMDCGFKESCLNDKTKCADGEVTGSTHVSSCSKSRLFPTDPSGNSDRCASVSYSFPNGIVECNAQGLVKRWQYFQSLNSIKYTSWLNAQKQELLRLDEIPPVLYTNISSVFVCESVAYLFADYLLFALEFRNQTVVVLDNVTTGLDFYISTKLHPRKVHQVNFVESLSIKLPIDTVAVHCLAPWINKTDIMNVTRSFEVKHLVEPYFAHSNVTEVNVTLHVGQTGNRLSCHIKGEPIPSYRWTLAKENSLSLFNRLIQSVGSNGEGYLEFPTVINLTTAANYKGLYTCIGTNSVGSISRRFYVDFEELPENDRPTITHFVLAVGFPILALISVFALILALVMIRRYRVSQSMLRMLTDRELDEFFLGRPELLNEKNGSSYELAEWLPYQNELEIPEEDLEFGPLLGKGNFSFVFKGKIKSTGQTVAIKTVKCDTGVDLFKTVLSEVKILMFIGDHENIVSLVGMSTGSIRNRSVAIVTELCELGSLDHLLVKSRSNFVDFLNENQEIDSEAFTQNQGLGAKQLTTLDLLDFSCQIANGMAYLSQKSVIHADLASRNVLITADKTVKISDFGLSKKLYQSENYERKSRIPLPWRWMALESLTTRTFSIKSDVWSYGVTLSEIFSLGATPFPTEDWTNDFVSRLSSGMRIGRPKFASHEIYTMMIKCWEEEPAQRPDFATIHQYFFRLFKKHQYVVDQTYTTVLDPTIASRDLSDFATVMSQESTNNPLYYLV